MFDVAEIGSTVEKDDYKARMPDLRAQLVEARNSWRLSSISRMPACRS